MSEDILVRFIQGICEHTGNTVGLLLRHLDLELINDLGLTMDELEFIINSFVIDFPVDMQSKQFQEATTIREYAEYLTVCSTEAA